MKTIKEIILAIFLILTTSCGEDFLKEQPLSFLRPENTYINAEGLQATLETALIGVFDQWHGSNSLIMFNGNMSDAFVTGKTDDQYSFADLRECANPDNPINNAGGLHLAFYEWNYRLIKCCNAVIDYIDEPEWEGEEKIMERNHLLGSAYFLRAFYYLQLTTQFGNVAFPLNVITESRQDFKVFHMEDIWDQMRTDLIWAVPHVKPKSELPVGQAPQDAARILLAKYLMMNLQFAEAETLMDQVIDGGESRLFVASDVNVDSVLVGNNQNPSTGELLDGINCNQPADAINLLHEASQRVTNPEAIWISPNAPFIEGTQRRNARIRSFGPNLWGTTIEDVKAPKQGVIAGLWTLVDPKSKQMHKWGRGQGFGRPSNYSQYDVWNRSGETDHQDYRHKRGNWFFMDMAIYDNPDLKDDTSVYGKPLQLWSDDGTVLLCEDTIRCWFGYPMYKFWTPTVEDKVYRQDGGKGDLYIYRIAEAYLIRAEARFWQDNFAGAAEDINIIRTRANAKHMYTVADVQNEGIAAILDERNRELYGEEYRHDELVRISVIFAKSGKTCYNGKNYSISGTDLERSLSANSFYYDRVMEVNNFFRDEVPWARYTHIRYTMDPMHIFWPVYEPFLIGNVEAKLNQTTGYLGSETNIEPLTHVVQEPGKPNIDPMRAIGE